MSQELALKIEGVSKQYRLGQIGGGTLQGDLQSWWARIRGKEDPNSKIGSKQHVKNERFWALDDVNIEVKKGEAVGIIGHNGAGKSTLLKLLSRVTAPTKGTISINGRIASMLEVGTGFHAEMTGRENIYMNGAILGMTKEEIDRKIDEIIDFSECRQFIDTPVKRYSSGMYVKLAFAVAAHLDSEILVMDEVLAVGDMKFQQKALGRMGDAAGQEGRTVLYVSHNMSTIRQLCTRCIVLNHGHVIFNGDVEEAISIYSGIEYDYEKNINLDDAKRPNENMGNDVRFMRIMLTNDCSTLKYDDTLNLTLYLKKFKKRDSLRIRLDVYYIDGVPVGVCESNNIEFHDEIALSCKLKLGNLPMGKYYFVPDIYEVDDMGRFKSIDHPLKKIYFNIVEDKESALQWDHRYMGHVRLNNLDIEKLG